MVTRQAIWHSGLTGRAFLLARPVLLPRRLGQPCTPGPTRPHESFRDPDTHRYTLITPNPVQRPDAIEQITAPIVNSVILTPIWHIGIGAVSAPFRRR